MHIHLKKGASQKEISIIEKRLKKYNCQISVQKGKKRKVLAVIGETSGIPDDAIEGLPGIERMARVLKTYKPAAQTGPLHDLHETIVKIGKVRVGGNQLIIMAGPCSVQNEYHIMKSAEIVKEAGCQILRGGVKKWRSVPTAWHGVGYKNLRKGLNMIVKAGREFDLPVIVEIMCSQDIPIYEDAGIDCLQVGAINSENQDLLDALANTKLPVLHKRGKGVEVEQFLNWVSRIMKNGKTNVIPCERGVVSGVNNTMRNPPDFGFIVAARYGLTHLPIAFDPSHSGGDRKYVIPLAQSAIAAGAKALIVEMHPNPLVALTDAKQGLFPEQLVDLVKICSAQWNVSQKAYKFATKNLEKLEKKYEPKMKKDEKDFAPIE